MFSKLANWLLGTEVRERETDGLVLGKGYLFGESTSRRRPIYVPHKLLNNSHLLSIGSSGCGKTRLLYSLLEQTLKNKKDQSVILMDPHGDLHQNVLDLIAQKVFTEGREELAERLVLIEPTNLRYGSVGLNILEAEENQLPYEIVSELISAFHAIEGWKEAWGARMEDILRNSCMALQERGLTLIEMPWLLMDEKFRGYVVSQLKNEDIKMYFEKQFNAFAKKDQHFFVESSRNKVGAFVSNPYLKPILGQTSSTIRFADIMNSGKICLINLSRNHLKTEARSLFGSLLFAKILMAILSRETIPEEERRPVKIFIDEVHEIFNKDLFMPVLSGGRKFKAQLAIFFQALSQLEDDELDVILGNSSTQISFQISRSDAEKIAREFCSFTGKKIKDQPRDLFGAKGRPKFWSVQEKMENVFSELMNQKVRECYIKFKGVEDLPYIARTLQVEYPERNQKWQETLREISAEKYNRSQEDIEKEIKERKEYLEEKMQKQREW